MNGQNEALRAMIAVVLGISYFLLHTILTYILRPEGFGVLFLIFAFGFIYQGLEYFFTIPSSPDKLPRMNGIAFFIFTVLVPFFFFGMMRLKLMGMAGLESELSATCLCILMIIAYKVFRFLFAVLKALSDKDE